MAKLGELYTELTVKDAGFNQGMASAKTVAESVGRSLDSLSSKAKWAFAGLAAGIGLTVKAAGESEGANLRLRTALELSGDGAVYQYQALVDLATELQKITIYDDEVTKGVMQYALQLGVGADKVGEYTKQAMGLASALNMDLQTAMRGLILAQNGEFAALSRYIPALRSATTDTEKLAAVNALATRGFAMAQAETGTLAGALTQVKNQLGEVAETMGAAFLPTIKEYASYLKDTLPRIGAWVDAHKEGLATFGKWALIVTGLVAAGGPLLRLVNTILQIVTALRAMAIGQAIVTALSGPKGWVLLAGAAVAAATAIWGINKAFSAVADSIAGATTEAKAFNSATGTTPGALAPDEFRTEPRPKFTPYGLEPRGIKHSGGVDREGAIVGVAELAGHLQLAAMRADETARQQAILDETKKQTDQMNQMIKLMEEQKMGLALV